MWCGNVVGGGTLCVILLSKRSPPPPLLHAPKSGHPAAEVAVYGTSGGWSLGEPRLPYHGFSALSLAPGALLVQLEIFCQNCSK